MEPTELERLLIKEVSGVDDPANQLPGWIVAKSAGEDEDIDAVAAEMEEFTKAADSKEPYGNVEYADPGYQKDGKKRYPLDSEQHIRAAWSYINQADNAGLYSPDQLAKIKAKIKSAMTKMGAEVAEAKKDVGSESTIVAKIKDVLLGTAHGKDEIDMDRDELTAILDERDAALVEKVAEAVVSKSVESPAEGEGASEAEASTEAPAAVAETSEFVGVTAEDITKSIQEALSPYNDILEKVLDRIEGVESALGVAARKSIDGQETNDEGEPVEKSTPDLADAISAAFKR